MEFISQLNRTSGFVMHHLKCPEPYYSEIDQGHKTFDLRKDDREFEYKVGDSLAFYQIKDGLITGNWIIRKVKYILKDVEDFGLKPGYVIMGLKPKS